MSGVKGQKHGVKNGPPYPISNGTRRRELSIEKAIRYQFDDVVYKDRDTYFSYTDKDIRTYEELIKSYSNNKPIYELVYYFKQPLKCPSEFEQKNTFNELVKDDDFKRGLNKIYKCRKLVANNKNTDFSDPKIKQLISDYNNDIIINNRAFRRFINWFCLRNIDPSIDQSKSMFIDALKSKGYNAITDLNDYGNMSEDPLIVFDIDELISKVSIRKLALI